MEYRTLHPISTSNDNEILEPGLVRSERDDPPADYTLKIESFSQLSEILKNTGVEKYESADFEAGGHKWKLVLYPYGNKKRNGTGHISLYLAISKSNTIPRGCDINAEIKFFVYDQIRDKYSTFQDGRVSRYHALKTEHGFHQLLPLQTFNDSSNGYLIDDCCAFGAEVHFIKCEAKGEKVSILKEPKNGTYTWRLEKFSALQQEHYSSEQFMVGQCKWNLQLYPKGDSRGKSKSLSLYLSLYDSNVYQQQKVYVEYKLLIKDQVLEEHHERKGNNWFSDSTNSWGYKDFMALSCLHDASKRFLVNDTLIVEAKIILISAVDSLF